VLVSDDAYWQWLFAIIAGGAILGVIFVQGWRHRGRPSSILQWLPAAGAVVLLAVASWLVNCPTINVIIVADGAHGPVATHKIWLGGSDHFHATTREHQSYSGWVVNNSSRELVLHELGASPAAERIPPGATVSAPRIRYLGPADPPPARPIAEPVTPTSPRFSDDGVIHENYEAGTPAQEFAYWLTW
jgi:hypothetical protein